MVKYNAIFLPLNWLRCNYGWFLYRNWCKALRRFCVKFVLSSEENLKKLSEANGVPFLGS